MTIKFHPPALSYVLKTRPQSLRNKEAAVTCKTCGELTGAVPIVEAVTKFAQPHQRQNRRHIIMVIEENCKFGL